jgi:hypothetical protein
MRWLCYSGVLIFLYMIMVSGLFRGWQPILIIPLAIAVAMRERELYGAIFGAFCGLVIDIAYSRLFGFTGIWLLPGCLTATLLVSHLIKVNLLNFLWINTGVCTIMAVTDYFFRYVIWRAEGAEYVLTDFIIPAYLTAVIMSPLMYFAVKGISNKFSLYEQITLSSAHERKDDNDEFKV